MIVNVINLLFLGALSIMFVQAQSTSIEAIMPADVNASTDTRRVLNYLANLPRGDSSSRIVIGQLAAHINHSDNYAKWGTSFGCYPGIYHWEARWDYGSIGFDRYVDLSVEAWRVGSLVTIGWSDKNPPIPATTIADCDVENPDRNQAAFNIFWNEWVSELVRYLRALDHKGVVVLLRPLHEPEGRAWISAGKSSFRNVWKQLFLRITVVENLHNVLFVLGIDSTKDTDYFPDPAFVDIAGTSEYVNPPYGEKDFELLNFLQSSSPYIGKPIAICETGSVKNSGVRADAAQYLAAIKRFAPFVCYLSWWHENPENEYQWAFYQSENAAEMLSDPWVITRETLDIPLFLKHSRSQK